MKKIFIAVCMFMVTGFSIAQDYINAGGIPLGLTREEFSRKYKENIREKSFHQGTYRYYLKERSYPWAKVHVFIEMKKLTTFNKYVITSVKLKLTNVNKHLVQELHKGIIDILSKKYGESKVSGNLKPIYTWENEDVLVIKESERITYISKEKYLINLQKAILKDSLIGVF
ncbi:MAG: hypothetical protein U9Q21_03800 [Candidatus Auribacterota bacterium]|nr:hypothetical protein [Candidatus Auribacterota bacterium]